MTYFTVRTFHRKLVGCNPKHTVFHRAYISSNVGWFHWFHSHNLELPYIPDFSLSLPTHTKWFHAFLTFWASEAFWEWTNNQELSPTSGLKNVRELNSSVCLQPLKCQVNYEILKYRGVQNGAQNYLRRTQAGPGRAGKHHQQGQTSSNLERTILCTSVVCCCRIFIACLLTSSPDRGLCVG